VSLFPGTHRTKRALPRARGVRVYPSPVEEIQVTNWLRLLLCLGALPGAACAAGSSAQNTTSPGGEPVDEADAAAELPDDEGELEEDAGIDPELLEGVCGDGVCNSNETCAVCEPDCGECPVCEHAPTCTGSVALPSASLALPSFDNGERTLYVSGVDESTQMPLGTDLADTNCIAPQLRLRVRQINIVRDGVSLGSADLYCVIDASDGAHSEVMITPLQTGVGDDAPPLVFPPEAATFWGQGKPWQTLNNLTITYQCFRSVNNQSYKDVFDAIQDGATQAGGVAGQWGWAFGVGGVAAGLISAAIPQGQDQVRIKVQQTIDKSMLLELTNGRLWKIRGTGQAELIGGHWDWSLEVEAWGCSEARIVAQ
jgi:hypothetical protein